MSLPPLGEPSAEADTAFFAAFGSQRFPFSSPDGSDVGPSFECAGAQLQQRVTGRLAEHRAAWLAAGAASESSIMDLVDIGLRLPWRDGPPPRHRGGPNYGCPPGSPQQAFLKAALLELVRFASCREVSEAEVWVVCPLGVCEKPSSPGPSAPDHLRKFRLIADHRFVNEFLMKLRMHLDGLGAFAPFLDPEDLLVTIDLSSAYYHVKIAPEDQKYMGFTYAGRFFVWTCLPFGLRTSPWAFTKLTRFCERHIRRKFNLPLHGYLDDFTLAIKPHRLQQDPDLVDKVVAEWRSFGWVLQPSKCELDPSTRREALGFLIDTHRMQFFVKPKRVVKVKAHVSGLLAELRALRPVSARAVSRVVGLIISCRLALGDRALLFTRYLMHDLRLVRDGQWDLEVVVCRQSFEHLAIWDARFDEWNGSDIRPRPFQASVFAAADASERSVAGFVYRTPRLGPCHLPIFADLDPTLLGSSSTRREMTGYHHTVKCMTQVLDLRGTDVLLDVDSLSAVHISQRGGSQALCPATATLGIHDDLLKLHLLQEEFGFRLRLRWNPRDCALQQQADDLSKDVDRFDFSLSPHWLSLALERVDVSGWVDRFASPASCVCGRFFSRYISDGAEGFDSLLFAWDEPSWIFPPFPLLDKVMARLAHSPCECILIVPLWPDRAWFHVLEHRLRPRYCVWSMVTSPGALVDINGCAFFGSVFTTEMVVLHLRP